MLLTVGVILRLSRMRGPQSLERWQQTRARCLSGADEVSVQCSFEGVQVGYWGKTSPG